MVQPAYMSRGLPLRRKPEGLIAAAMRALYARLTGFKSNAGAWWDRRRTSIPFGRPILYWTNSRCSFPGGSRDSSTRSGPSPISGSNTARNDVWASSSLSLGFRGGDRWSSPDVSAYQMLAPLCGLLAADGVAFTVMAERCLRCPFSEWSPFNGSLWRAPGSPRRTQIRTRVWRITVLASRYNR